jgi:hypothetical protein
MPITKPPKPPPPTRLYLAMIQEARRLLAGRAWHMHFMGEPLPVKLTLRLASTAPMPISVLPWQRVQDAFNTFWPTGVEVTITPRELDDAPHGSMGAMLRLGSREGSRQMAAARNAKVLPSRRSRIAKRASRERWARVRAARAALDQQAAAGS